VRQVRLVAPHKLALEQVRARAPKRGEVRVRVAYCGVCGSDVHAFEGRHPFISTPILQGHEFSGTVERVGAGVRGLKPGDRVTAEPSLTCGTCFSCRHGRYNICRRLRVLGCQAPGAFAEYITLPAHKAVKLPSAISLRSAALIEPLAVGVHAVRIGAVQPDEHVVVVGAGTIGLMVMQAARARGCRVLQTDILPYRLRAARRLGASRVADLRKTRAATAVRGAFGARGADVIFECAGSQASTDDAFAMARKGTRLVMTAVYANDLSVPMGIVQDWELDLRGTLMYTMPDYRLAIRELRNGNVNADGMITHELPLEQLEQAYRLILERDTEKIKVLIRVS